VRLRGIAASVPSVAGGEARRRRPARADNQD
jgi:hypothetical protein